MLRTHVHHARDRFPTTKLAIPNLAKLVWRLRDDRIANCVTIVHALREGEGEWALAIAAARLARDGVKTIGPEPSTVHDLVEYGVHVGARIVFCGELRRADDGRALRAAAALGVKTVGVVTSAVYAEAELMVRALGPWSNCDLSFFSIAL
jgi:hypothetical protein